MTEILLADDHGIVRLGTSIVVKEVLPKANITQAEDYDEMIRLLEEKPFDLLFLDINMPGGNNIKMVSKILEIQPAVKILVYSSYEETLYALRYMQAGAHGFLSKNSSKAELAEAITSVLERGKYMTNEVRDQYFDSITKGKAAIKAENPINKLSNREVDVARHLAQGMGVIEVSKEMNLSTSTVSTYKTRIFEKLQVDNIIDFIDKFRLHSEN